MERNETVSDARQSPDKAGLSRLSRTKERKTVVFEGKVGRRRRRQNVVKLTCRDWLAFVESG